MVRIISLETKVVSTQYGEKEKFIGLFENSDGSQVKADAFVGKWNRSWSEGDEIDIKTEQWKSRDYQGKKFWSISAPPEARISFNQGGAEISNLTKKVSDMQTYIDTLLPFLPLLQQLDMERRGYNTPNVPTKRDIMQEPSIPVLTGDEQEIRIDDEIPF